VLSHTSSVTSTHTLWIWYSAVTYRYYSSKNINLIGVTRRLVNCKAGYNRDDTTEISTTPTKIQPHPYHKQISIGPSRGGERGKFSHAPRHLGAPPLFKNIFITFDSKTDHLSWAYVSYFVTIFQQCDYSLNGCIMSLVSNSGTYDFCAHSDAHPYLLAWWRHWRVGTWVLRHFQLTKDSRMFQSI